jgi:hypothetical protein
MSEFEDEELLKAKKTRTIKEYYWTLSPSLPLYVLKTYKVDHIGYLDADLYFFSSPEPIYQEFNNKSVLIVPHRLSEARKDVEERVGKYNVSLLLFRNDKNGIACLNWWRARCNEWCYDRTEPGRYGDQKYLDFFEEQFEGVHVIEHKGVNLAPWNLENKKVWRNKNEIYVESVKVIFFHFSRFDIYEKHIFLPYGPNTIYRYTKFGPAKKYLYSPYSKSLYNSLQRVRRVKNTWTIGVLPRSSISKTLTETFYNSVLYPIRYVIKYFYDFIR